MQHKRFAQLFVLTLALLLLADFAAPVPAAVDQPLPLTLWVPLLLHFFLWLASAHSWGRLLARTCGEKEPPAGLSLGIGSLCFALAAALIGAAGLLRPELRFFLFIVEALGIALSPGARLTLPEKKILAAWVPLALVIFLNALDALVIHPYWDPLHHHLAGARRFWEAGEIIFPPEAIASYQEGGFELLFLWPHFFFARAGGLGLLPVQIFAQLTHCLLGFGGALLLAYSFARRWLTRPEWAAFAVLLFAAPFSLRFAIPMAKNDWGIVLWALSGFWLLSAEKRSPARLALGGILWGFAFLAKLSSGFALAGLASVLVFRRYSAKEILFLLLGCFAGVLPLALRNFLGTGDPLFPLFPSLFPTHENALGPTWRVALSEYTRQGSPARMLLVRAREFALELPVPGGALLGAVFTLGRREDPALRAAGLSLLAGLVMFAATTGTASELRLLGALLPISGLLLGVLLYRIVNRLPFNTKQAGWMLLLAAAAAFPYRFESLKRSAAIPHGHLLTRGYVSGEAQGWLRDNFWPGMKVAMLVETRAYHSLPLPLIRIWDFPALDRRLNIPGMEPARFLSILREEGFTHLLLSDERLDLFYPRSLVQSVEQYVFARAASDALVFRSEHSVLVDLARFSEAHN